MTGEPLAQFAPGLWLAGGPVVRFLGFPYSTRMAVIGLGDGGLFVWSPVALTRELRGAIAALGTVRHVVAPNVLHHLYLGEWRREFPEARLVAAPKLKGKRRDLFFDAELGDAADPAWADQIGQVLVRGSFAMTEAVFFHRASRTAIFADLIQNFPENWFRGWRRVLARHWGITAHDPGTPREWRLTFWNRRAARRALRRILAWEPERVVMAHGTPVCEGGAAFIARALRWLDP